MIFKLKLLFNFKLIFLLVFFVNIAEAKISNKIVAFINEMIITTEDLNQEIIYLNIISGDKLSDLEKKEQNNIALDALISQKVKEIEISNYNNFSLSDEGTNFYLNKIFLKNNIDNLDNFKIFLKSKNYTIEKLKKKITTDLLWNNLILNLYANQVKLNKKQVEEKIEFFKNKKKVEEYLISEIFLLEEDVGKLKQKKKFVIQEINDKGFEYAALNYSNSDSSSNEGKLDWINEKEINEKFLNEIKKLKIGEISKPITDMKGIFIFKLLDKKQTENKINMEDQVKQIIEKEKNRQLNFFSTHHYNKLKAFHTIRIVNE